MIFLAPHLVYPPRHGADIYVERLARHLSQFRGQTHLLGASELLIYHEGNLVDQQPYPGGFRAKSSAALRTLARGSHYYVEKFLTPAFRTRAAHLLTQHPTNPVICSYLATASLLQDLPWRGASLTLTQNDEIAWFSHQVRSFKNPLQKAVAWLSARWVKKFLRQHGATLTLAHITEADQAAYETYCPGHRSLLVPAGVDIAPLLPLTLPDGTIRLVFAGSLSMRMNADALQFFKDRFWPVLSTLPGIEMTVMGSAPLPEIRALCLASGWQLLPDLPDDAFRAALSRAHFSVLPFPYTTGAKLKLLTSLAAGVPVLATPNMNILPGQNFSPNLYADDPQAWQNHLQRYAQGVDEPTRAACYRYASQYSWEAIARKLSQDFPSPRGESSETLYTRQ